MVDSSIKIELEHLKKINRDQRRQAIDSHVEQEMGRLRIKQPQANQEYLVQQARDKVAARITRERLKEEIKKAKNEAIVDKLTGLYNLKGFEQRLKEEAIRSKRLGQSFAIVILDANNLKLINDTQGHLAGDSHLKTISGILEKASRTSDVTYRQPEEKNQQNAARWGGDEFGVLLLDTDLEGAKIWWKRVENLFKENDISIGAGLAMVTPEDLNIDTNIGEILKNKRHEADTAMYIAKDRSKEMKSVELVIHHPA